MKKPAFVVVALIPLLSSCYGGSAASGDAPFAVASAHWTDRAEAHPSTITWADDRDERGLVVVVRREQAEDTLMVHSTDFALAFEDEAGIPRRPCIGISRGMASAGQEVTWSAVGGSVSRYWMNPGETHFAVLFSAPKEVKSFTLQRSVGLRGSFEPKTP